MAVRRAFFHITQHGRTEVNRPSTSSLGNRKRWENFRTSFRKDWSKEFGDWPEEEGVAWPEHHIRDLHHGGDPVDPSNIIPVEPGVHTVFNRADPACYGGQAPWNTVGPNLPYSDN